MKVYIYENHYNQTKKLFLSEERAIREAIDIYYEQNIGGSFIDAVIDGDISVTEMEIEE